MSRLLTVFVLFFIILNLTVATDKPKKKKDVRDFTDADLERLYEEWEENDEDELEEDEKPQHMRNQPPPAIDLNTFSGGTPEEMLKMTKKGQPVMMFAGIVDPSGKPVTKEFTDGLVKIWQTALFNNHIECQVYVIEDNRIIVMIPEGSLAFDARDFLLKQEQVVDVTVEGKITEGAGHKYAKKDDNKAEL